MSRLALLSLTAAAVLALPASASAVNIGSDHPAADGQWSCATGQAPCVVMQGALRGDLEDNVVPANGRLTYFSLSNGGGPLKFVVTRRGGGTRVISEETVQFTGAGAGTANYDLTPDFPVQAGDEIAVHLVDGTSNIGVRNGATDPDGTSLFEYALDDLVTLQDDDTYEVLLSAEFVQATTGGGTQITPRKRVVVKPDPLAALRKGGKPSAKIAGGSVKTSKKGVALIKVSNPNAYKLSGSLKVLAGKLKIGKAKVSLAPGATKAFKVKLSKKGRKKLRRKRKLKATVVGKLKGPVGKARVLRKKITLKAPKKKKKPRRRRRRGGGTPGGGGGGNTWKARFGNSGKYDDFKFKLDGSRITLTKPALPFIGCYEMGDNYDTHFSYELFNVGPWKLGAGEQKKEKQGVAVNRLVHSGKRTIRYKFRASRSGNKIAGNLGMSFFESKYDYFTNDMWMVSCTGFPKWEAIPA